MAERSDEQEVFEAHGLEEGDVSESQEISGEADAAEDDIEIVEQQAQESVDEDKEVDTETEKSDAKADDEPATTEQIDEDAEFSRRTRERIAREREVTARERGARYEAELGRVAAEKQLAEVLLSQLDRDIEDTKKKLIRAKEEGNTADEVELVDQLSEKRAKKREVESAKSQTELREQEIRERSVMPVQSPANNGPSAEARSWMGKNRWFNDPRFKAESFFVMAIDTQLAKEGVHDKNSPEYFKELDRRIKENLPDLTRKVSDSFKPRPSGQPPRSNAAPVGAGRTESSGGSVQSKKKFVLTAEHRRRMTEFKMEPTNPDHVKSYARSVMGLN